MEKIKQHFLEAHQVLTEFLSKEANIQAIEAAGNLLVNTFKQGNRVYSFGNGGSMCDAMHFAEELTGRYRDDRKPFPAMCIADPSHMSCVSNDYGYEHVFERFIEGFAVAGDCVLAISTSGNSINVIRAVKKAQDKGAKVIALTGKDGGELAQLADVEIRAPKSKFADRAQEIHIKIIHSLIDYIERNS